MRILNEAQVRQCLPLSVAIKANRKALGSIRSSKKGGAFVPTRLSIPSSTSNLNSPDCTLIKPAAYFPPSPSSASSANIDTNTTSTPRLEITDDDAKDETVMGMKCISVRSQNTYLGLPSNVATILLLNAETGQVSAMLAASYLTAIRTAAGSAIATEMFLESIYMDGTLDKDLNFVVFGAGLQAEMHIRAIHHLNPLSKITIVNRSRQRAENLKQKLLDQSTSNSSGEKDDYGVLRDFNGSIDVFVLNEDTQLIEAAVRSANIVVTAVSTFSPLFPGKWASSGCHFVSVGSFTPNMVELDSTLIDRCRVIIDTPEAKVVGDLKHLLSTQGGNNNIIGLLGDFISGEKSLMERDGSETSSSFDCTCFKSVGTAIQDVVTGIETLKYAKELGLGMDVDMDEGLN